MTILSLPSSFEEERRRREAPVLVRERDREEQMSFFFPTVGGPRRSSLGCSSRLFFRSASPPCKRWKCPPASHFFPQCVSRTSTVTHRHEEVTGIGAIRPFPDDRKISNQLCGEGRCSTTKRKITESMRACRGARTTDLPCSCPGKKREAHLRSEMCLEMQLDAIKR